MRLTVEEAAGYTLIEVLMVGAVAMIVAAAAVPQVAAGLRRYALNNASQQVASTIRAARYAAVSKSTTLRIRFNCPAAGQYRVVEVTGTGGIDQASDRCSNTAYPFPDPTTGALPDNDGPVLVVPAGTAFGAVEDMEISAEGRVTALTGCPACAVAGGLVTLALENGYETQATNIGQNGQIEVEAVEDLE
jgi:Tfp pilus assembly protein FimT